MIAQLSVTVVFMSFQPFFSMLSSGLGIALLVMAAGYACAILWAALKSRAHFFSAFSPLPEESGVAPVTVLKPLHGLEPRLYDNLRGFCTQDHPCYQLIFGVRESNDPAISVVHRLMAEFPNRDICLVVDDRVYGANLKVSNLLNMLPQARYDGLVLADADIDVPPDYLRRVTAPLADAGVGIVTCLYYGQPQSGFWSRLGCLFIDDWFAPSVRLSYAAGSRRFAFGSTIALRRDALMQVGGFEVLKDTLADDFWVGELTRQAGLKTVLSEVVVGTEVTETQCATLWRHELRWLRTIRSISPVGFAFSFVCFTWPVCLIGLLLASGLEAALWLTLAAVGARVAQFFLTRGLKRPSLPWYEVGLMPIRDLLLFVEWIVALTSWRVSWRGQILHARKDGPVRLP